MFVCKFYLIIKLDKIVINYNNKKYYKIIINYFLLNYGV
jgi:hypothetical protein